MSRTVTIVTPENIEVTYETAGIASRFMATLIDLTIQIVLIVLALAVFNLASRTAGLGGLTPGASSLVSAVGILAVFCILFVYATFFEMIWGGRTPGKRLLGLRVIRDGGYPINLIASLIRNILRFIDFGILPLPTPIVLCGLPGLTCVFFSPRYQRIGDYAAGTLVIVETGQSALRGSRQAQPLPQTVEKLLPYVRNVDRITREEYGVLRRFSVRRSELELVAQAALGQRLATPLIARLEIEAPIAYQIQYADLLEAIERRYTEEYGLL